MRFLLFLAYIAVEFYLVIKVVEASGFWLFVLEIAVSALLGLGILASQFSVMSESLRNIMTFNLSVSSFLGRSILRFLGGIMLILPFVLSDILGLTFFIMSLFFRANEVDSRNDFGEKFGSDFEREFDFSSDSNNKGDIIDAEIIERVEEVTKQ